MCMANFENNVSKLAISDHTLTGSSCSTSFFMRGLRSSQHRHQTTGVRPVTSACADPSSDPDSASMRPSYKHIPDSGINLLGEPRLDSKQDVKYPLPHQILYLPCLRRSTRHQEETGASDSDR
jgi:hypothetical protein